MEPPSPKQTATLAVNPTQPAISTAAARRP